MRKVMKSLYLDMSRSPGPVQEDKSFLKKIIFLVFSEEVLVLHQAPWVWGKLRGSYGASGILMRDIIRLHQDVCREQLADRFVLQELVEDLWW